ncbi:MAG: alcohol dehydrogenase catalytic domain-containing protein [Polyangiaceae bacterium]|jgi:threonine dehydrogenase-like Zn-dependent dehydrogenase|nr:alcohol dehydrogenase catalytic domain-containing protein [Polyangiaceae bacterium]
MRALVLDLSIPRYAAALVTRRKIKSLLYGRLSSLSLREVPEPALPGADWVKLAPRATGLCGTDLSAIFQKASPTLSVLQPLPAVLGHEILAEVAEVGPGAVGRVKEGDRVVVDPVLHCETRGLPACAWCEQGVYGTCERHFDGGGAILGYSRQYPGGFADRMVAHRSQLFRVPDSVDDDGAVLAEPFSVAVHAVLPNLPRDGEQTLVIGGGIIAFATLWALKQLNPACRVTLFTIEPYQREIALALGADRVLGPGDLLHLAAQELGTRELKPILGRGFLVGGYDVVFDCIGTERSLGDALRVTRPRGAIVLVGAAGILDRIDLSTVWSREQRLIGSVYYGHEDWRGQRRRTFDLTLELLSGCSPGSRLVTHRLPLSSYGEAIEVSTDRSKHRSVKAVLTP